MNMIKRILFYLLAVTVIIAGLLVIKRSGMLSGRIGAEPLPYLLAGVVLLIVFIIILIYSIFRSSSTSSVISPRHTDDTETGTIPEPPASSADKAEFSVQETGKYFARQMGRLKAESGVRNYHYKIPWVLMLGEAASGKTTALRQSDPYSDIPIPIEKFEKEKHACEWRFFEKGIVLDAAGDLILREGGGKADANAKIWRYVLGQLQKYRSRRPADGVILTIPCTDLIFSDDYDRPAVLSRISEKADILYHKLLDLQKTLGMRFPVYILISKCDHIAGFQSFCKTLPQKLRDHIFGWSSPYTIEAAYSSEWVHEAFQTMHSNLFRTQFEIFTEGADLKESDGLFVFPSHFRKLAEPLQAYTDRLFKSSVYYESFIFRGIYFCGDGGTEPEKSGRKGAYVSSAMVRPVFLKDLLTEKIFPEFEIARPVEHIIRSRNRMVNAAQIAAGMLLLSGLIGLWIGSEHLQKKKNDMKAVYAQIKDDRHELDRLETFDDEKRERFFTKSTENLSKGTQTSEELKSVFIPSSYVHLPFLGKPREEIKDSLSVAYKEIIFDSMRYVLLMKGRQIFSGSQEPAVSLSDMRDTANLAPEKSPEFQRLKNFVNEFKEFEVYFDIYNNLGKSGTMEDDLKRLTAYLFNARLEGRYDKNWRNIKNYEPIKNRIFEIMAKEGKIKELSRNFYEKTFESSAVVRNLQNLSDKLEEFRWKSDVTAKRGSPIKELTEGVLEEYGAAEKAISPSSLSWMSKPEFSPGNEFDAVCKAIENSKFLGKALAADIYYQGSEQFGELKGKLRQQQSSLTGPLLEEKNGNVILKFSPNALECMREIKALNEQEFLAGIPEREGDVTTGCPPGTRVEWDLGMLEEIIGMLKPYENYINIQKEKRLKNDYLRKLQKRLADASEISMNEKLWRMLPEARQFVPLPEKYMTIQYQEIYLAAEIKNFRQASKLLNTLLKECGKLGLKPSYDVLAAVLQDQTDRLLDSVSRLLDSEKLYEIRKGDNFSWWDAQEGQLSLAAFEAADAVELEYYLKLQRDRIRRIVYEYAEPLFALYVSNGQKNKRDFRVLERVMQTLEQHDNKKPDNSLTALEKFILFDMNHVTEENYYKKINPLAAKRSSDSPDIFLERKNYLETMLYQRCQELSAKRIVGQYNELREVFNTRLAGNFPFSGVKNPSDANPEDIRDFYRIFDADAAILNEVLKTNRQFGVSGGQVRDFLERMKTVRKVFASYLSDDKAPENVSDEPKKEAEDKGKEKQNEEEKKKREDLPVLDFDIEFRVNRKYETAANKIIDWHLKIGEQEFQYGGEKNTGRWRFGDPVTLSLRWAKNAEDYPYFGGKGKITEPLTVVYEPERNMTWSLLRFLRSYASPLDDFEHIADPKPHTLEFEFETVRAGSEGKEEGKSRAKAFIRVGLMSPDKIQKMLVLPRFPEKAPELNLKSLNYSELKLYPNAKADDNPPSEKEKEKTQVHD